MGFVACRRRRNGHGGRGLRHQRDCAERPVRRDGTVRRLCARGGTRDCAGRIRDAARSTAAGSLGHGHVRPAADRLRHRPDGATRAQRTARGRGDAASRSPRGGTAGPDRHAWTRSLASGDERGPGNSVLERPGRCGRATRVPWREQRRARRDRGHLAIGRQRRAARHGDRRVPRLLTGGLQPTDTLRRRGRPRRHAAGHARAARGGRDADHRKRTRGTRQLPTVDNRVHLRRRNVRR